jgi:2-dehydro-3-deoxyphosphogluconate aldolase/(4S)-4-hydroxy-2-oxoglutarate aldolase
MNSIFTPSQVVTVMKENGLVPLFTTDNVDDAIHVVETSYKAGLRTFEFTNRRSNSYDVFVKVLEYCRRYPDLMLGIGTIMDGPTTEKFISAGAHFIISPIVKTEMAEVCHRHNVAWIPGCFTLTEIVLAKDNGAAIIKLFPGSSLGPQFVSSIMPVVPGLKLMITGGVEPSPENLEGWFRSGATCVGMGSQLFSKDIMEKRDWTALSSRITSILSTAYNVRSVRGISS